MKATAALIAAPATLVLLFGATFDDPPTDPAGVNVRALPEQARAQLPYLAELLHQRCPQLPVIWVLAEVQAESSWNPRAYSPAGAAGLLQMTSAAWRDAEGQGGSWPVRPGPGPDHPVWQPRTHLQIATSWMCGNLHLVARHLQATGKPISVLDALAVCHIAGCSRVTESRTGLPTTGEAGCDSGCVQQIRDYLRTIHDWVFRYTPLTLAGTTAGAPDAFPGGPSGCVLPDPTGTGGCVTAATAWLLGQVAARVGPQRVTCWDPHPQNPNSDHPLGKACDFLISRRLGTFAEGTDLTRGWQLAQWLRTYAGPLAIAYLIWQGRIWSQARHDEGWRPYSGGGIYDPAEATGGHYDHIHVSLTR